MSRKALGKGLSALIPGEKEEIKEVEIDSLHPHPFQSRKDFSSQTLQELAESIKRRGILQPIIARPSEEGYQIVAGERRWRAAKEAGLKKVPVIIRQLSDEQVLETSLMENIQREDLNPIERAEGYRLLIEKFHLTQEELAKRVGKDRSSISNTLRLLKLPPYIQKEIREGKISEGHARVLLSVSEKERPLLLKKILKKQLSVRDVESLARKRKRKEGRVKEVTNPWVEKLQRLLNTKVYLQEGKKKGKLVIEYYSYEDLERILETLGVTLS